MNIPKKYKDSVRSQLKMFFPENLPEIFVNDFSEILIIREKTELQTMNDYTELRFENHLSKGTKLALTPNGILLLIKAIETLVGRNKYQKSPKYQKAREIFDIIPALLALKKATGVEYFAHLRDDPDFELIPNIGLQKYFFKEFHRYELMYISSFETLKWNKNNPLPELVDFIVKKKFNKAYGENVGLIFHLAIDSNKLSSKVLAKVLANQTSKNPYTSIWMIAVTSSTINKEDIGFTRLLPSHGSIVIKHEEQLKLLY